MLFHNQNEVARAIELREIVTSLGPAYIKLGQALSIRPDILSPSAMIELQKLCDKVKCLCFFIYLLLVVFFSISDVIAFDQRYYPYAEIF